MTQAQCPSTRGTLEVAGGVRPTPRMSDERKVWRSLEEYAGTPAFREFVEREFPAGASELLASSRRTFVKLMGASLALAGVAALPGCRRPDHKILSYSREHPEEIIVGQALFYATSIPMVGGGARGLLVESHEGRPTKLEGNPLHPSSRGKASGSDVAQILGLYDPDRLKYPVYANPARGKLAATWDDFRSWWTQHAAGLDSDGGAGLAIVAPAIDSPARRAVRARFESRYPNATWVSHDPLSDGAAREGSVIAFGRAMREVFDFGQARVIVSLDRDPMADEAGALSNARQIGAMRSPMRSGDPMSRVYVAESGYSTLGAIADHRVALAPERVTGFAIHLAKALLAKPGFEGASALRAAVDAVQVPAGADLDDLPAAHAAFFEAMANDLASETNRGHSVILAGRTQPAAVHALAHALNAALGNAGRTVRYVEDNGAAPGDLAGLVARMKSGQVRTLVCVDTNPVYDAPAGLGFAEAMAQVGATVTLSVGQSETAAASTWSLNAAHPLECWGDSVGHDGTLAPQQPMIAPLYEPARSELEFVAMLAGEEYPDGYEIVRAAWQESVLSSNFDKRWRRALHDGIVAGTARNASAAGVRMGEVASAVSGLRVGAAPTGSSLAVVFRSDTLGGGRDANNAWLQETPDPITKVSWDNPALVSPATAKALKLEPDDYTARQEPRGRVAKLTFGGRSIEIPVWICPGLADDTVVLTLGYGRTHAGLVGNGVGTDVYAVRESGEWAASGATLERTGRSFPISSTQDHWSLEGRTAVARALDVQVYRELAAAAEHEGHELVNDPYVTGAQGDLGMLGIGERLGELTHTPANINAYKNPQNDSMGNAKAGSPFSKRPQWGMTIDMSACTGCQACMVACQSENNIPVVGKDEVAKGREMHWIRVDRYFVGDDVNRPDAILLQPVACVQCENAPCETVCPVNATVHDEEGLNVMAYNRCIGTRYCMNNCPYKARRFNFFDWAQSKYNGGLDERYVTETIADDITPTLQEHSRDFNQNFIPPRLREKLDEISKMRNNPNVTVRGRGVMEKCTYCLQRINNARFEMKLQDLDNIPDGFFQVACQQACPTDAIVFGDILDPDSRVAATRRNQRSYLLLGYLNTRPRTSHLIALSNPNPDIREPITPAALSHGSHGGGHGGGHGDEGDHAEEGVPHTFRLDPSRRGDDRGYALSLNLLGVHA